MFAGLLMSLDRIARPRNDDGVVRMLEADLRIKKRQADYRDTRLGPAKYVEDVRSAASTGVADRETESSRSMQSWVVFLRTTAR